MPNKRRWANKYPALIFTVFLSFSTLVSFANPIAMKQKTSTTQKRSRLAVEILGGGGFFNSYFGNGIAFGATFSYGFSKNIAIELAGLFINGKGENDPDTIYKGKLTILPLQLSLIGRFPLNKRLTPYLLAGGSYFINRFALNSSDADGWKNLGITLTEKVNNAFGFHFGAGLEYALGSALSVAIDTRYCLGKTKGNWSIKDSFSGVETNGTFSDLNLNTMIFSVGLKYFFK